MRAATRRLASEFFTKSLQQQDTAAARTSGSLALDARSQTAGAASAQPLNGRNGDHQGSDHEIARLRARVEEHLISQGFQMSNGRLLVPVIQDKDQVRDLQYEAVAALRERARGSLARHEDRLLPCLARGTDIVPERIQPALVPIVDRRSFEGLLWRWCSLHWSIPVSSGYGRRLRFLVVDRGHGDKVIGLIGLADPVFALRMP